MKNKPAEMAPEPPNAVQENATVQNVPFQTFKVYAKKGLIALSALAGDLTAIILGISFFWLCGVNILLAQKTVKLDFLERNLSLWFSEAFEGKKADISHMTLNWRAHDNQVILKLGDVVVYDNDERAVQSIETLDAYFRLRDVASGTFDPITVNVTGGQFTWYKDEQGAVLAGLGTPETVGRFGPVWRGDLVGSNNQGNRNLNLNHISIDNAAIFVRDEQDGLDITFQDSSLIAEILEDDFEISAAGTLFSGGKASNVDFEVKGSRDLSTLEAKIKALGANPNSIAPKTGRFASLRQLDAPIDLDVTLQSENSVLTSLDVSAQIGSGEAVLLNRRSSFNGAKFSGGYSKNTQIFNLTSLELDSEVLALSGSAKIGNIGSPDSGFLKGDVPIDISVKSLRALMSEHFLEPLNIQNLTTNGTINRLENRAIIDNFEVDIGENTVFLKGVFDANDDREAEAIELTGGVNGTLSKDGLLALWPKNVILGARNWIKNSVLGANLNDLTFSLSADSDALKQAALPNEAFEMTFNLSEGSVRYIRTMTPVTNAVGRGLLEGNRATFYLERGNIDALKLSNGTVSIPRIYPYGGEMVIEADGAGPVVSMLSLIDQKPFEYVSKYGVDATEFSGNGAIRVKITRPLRERVKYSDVTYSVTGKLSDVSAPFSVGPHTLRKGHVFVLADSNGLSVKGPVNLGPWEADLVWLENFDEGLTPTQYKISGLVTQDVLDDLGLGLRAFMSGQFFLEIDAIADGLDIREAALRADLTDSDLRIAPFWEKPSGIGGHLKGKMSFIKSQGLSLDDILFTAPDLEIAGGVSFAENFKLLNLNFDTVKIAQFIDAAMQLKPSDDSARFDMFVTGDYLNVSPFIGSFLSQSGTGQLDVPVLFTGAVSQLALDDMFVLKNANALFAHNGQGVTQARLKGDAENGALSLNLTTNADEAARRLSINVPNASDAAFAFFNLENILGGQLNLNADMPLAGVDGPVRGSFTLLDGQIVNVPVLARLLSLASLQGLTDTLSGEGLKFDTLDVPFSWQNGTLSVREARAAGPALGMTGNGEINFAEKSLDLDGVLVPAYTANSLLGDIPILGDIFVGRRGEGVFALSYSVQGPFEKSQVSVNPLSALTPGFLRDIFRPKREALPQQLLEAIEEVKPAQPSKLKPPK